MSKDAVGARTKVAIAEQTAYATKASTVSIGLDITSEALTNDIAAFTSGALRADRAVHKRVRGNQSAGGDINFEQNSEGFLLLYKHAFGRGITLPEVDGGIRGQLAADTSAGQETVVLVNVVGGSTFNASAASGADIIAVTYGTDSTGALNYCYTQYSAFDVATSTLTVSDALGALSKGDFVFLRDSTNYVGIYSHYVEAYEELPLALSVEVYRDIAVFDYIGCRINSLAETYPTNEMLTGSINVLARQEWSGDWLSADTSVAQATITLEDASLFPESGVISIADEDDMAYASKSGNIITMTDTINSAHSQYDPVYLSEPATTYTYSDTDPFSSFEANLYMDNVASEVLSANYTLTNNLYADKFQIGSKYRVRAPEQGRTVEGSLNVEFDDMTLYSKFVRGTSARLEIRCIKDVEEIVADKDVYYQKHMIFSNIEFNGTTPTTGGPELMTHDIPFTALFDDVYDKPEVIAIFVNSQSSLDAST